MTAYKYCDPILRKIIKGKSFNQIMIKHFTDKKISEFSFEKL
jgi:hypothetical protein